jgi:hypothetical protein
MSPIGGYLPDGHQVAVLLLVLGCYLQEPRIRPKPRQRLGKTALQLSGEIDDAVQLRDRAVESVADTGLVKILRG